MVSLEFHQHSKVATKALKPSREKETPLVKPAIKKNQALAARREDKLAGKIKPAARK